MTPNEQLIAFIDGLSAMIRANVCGRLAIFFTDDVLDDEDWIGIIRRLLMPTDEIEQHKIAVLACGALDYVLSEDIVEETTRRIEYGRKIKSKIIEEVAMELPLRGKYWDQAVAAWVALRQSDLSFEALRRFEKTQWALLLSRPQES